MTHEEIAASWATRGDIARASSFSICPEVNENVQHFIVELTSLGKEGKMTARLFRTLPLDAGQTEIEAALDSMYVEMRDAPANARAYEWRPFEK